MKKDFSLAEKMKELEEIEAYFNRSDLELEEGIIKHQKATKLAKEILEYLSQAKSEIEKVELPE